MNFSFETQGAITYLVCELESTEQVDTLTLGMLTNNHIVGFAPVVYTEMNGQRFLKYNISAKVSADQFFSGNMNKQRTLNAFHNILRGICSADEYMIQSNCFAVEPEHIYLNVSNCETALVCIPVETEKDINVEVSTTFKNILMTSQFEQGENTGYITEMITYINSGAFNIYEMKSLVERLQSTTSAPSIAPSSAQPVVPSPVQPAPPVQINSFDSTISIDDMPAMMGQKPQSPMSHPVAPKQVTPSVPVTPSNIQTPPLPKPVTPVPVQQVVPQRPPVVPQKPANTSVVQTPGMTGGAKPFQSRPVQKPPISNGPGFAIPGQPAGVNIPTPSAKQAPKAAKPPKAPKANENGDKKMSIFGLLAHYNKENVELYKAQKEANKKPKTKAVPQPPASQGAVKPSVVPTPPMGQQNVQPPVQPQYQPPVQPVPVQSSFNETTVLSAVNLAGETTVLSAEPSIPQPYLTRVKTGERICINKPVFRIGKEKSYVDYFIADNTAISRSHANIHTENGEYFVEDTNSTNHTYLNGAIITSNVKTKLTSGDKIRFANEDFTFSL